MPTVPYEVNQANLAEFETLNNVDPSCDYWTPQECRAWELFISLKYNLVDHEDYVVDSEPMGMSDYEADCMTLGHDF